MCFSFISQICAREIGGEILLLRHRRGTEQDVATSDLCPTAATESPLCVVPACAHPAFKRFYQRPRVVLQKAEGEKIMINNSHFN